VRDRTKKRTLRCKKPRRRQRNKLCGYWICDVYNIVSKVNKVVPELKHHAMKTLEGNEEMVHAFLTSARAGGERSASSSGRFT
jgi:hypothetical protein